MWVIIFPRNSSYFISILLFSAVTVGIFYDALKNSHGAQVIELAALNVYYFPLFQTFLNNIKTCGKLLRSFADDLAENLPVLLKMQGTCKILCVFGSVISFSFPDNDSGTQFTRNMRALSRAVSGLVQPDT